MCLSTSQVLTAPPNFDVVEDRCDWEQLRPLWHDPRCERCGERGAGWVLEHMFRFTATKSQCGVLTECLQSAYAVLTQCMFTECELAVLTVGDQITLLGQAGLWHVPVEAAGQLRKWHTASQPVSDV